MKPILFTILDTETTGLNPMYGDMIIEIALLQVEFDGENFREVRRFDSLVRPDMEVTERVSYITGITMDDLEDAPRFDEIREKVLEFLPASARLNSSFVKGGGEDFPLQKGSQPSLFSSTNPPTPLMKGGDTASNLQSKIENQESPIIVIGHNIDFDLKFLEYSGIATKDLVRIDTMDLATLFEEGGKSLSLESLAMRYGVAHDAHRAMGDVVATFEVFKHYAEVIKQLPDATRKLFSIIVQRSDWPAKVLFPKSYEDTIKTLWQAYFDQAAKGGKDVGCKVQDVSTEKYPPGGGKGGVLIEKLTENLQLNESSVIQIPCPMQHLPEVIQSLSTASNRVSLVLHPFYDKIAKIVEQYPGFYRPAPLEHIIDPEQMGVFLEKDSWSRSQVFFVLKLLKWINTTTTYNTRELQLKNSEKPYLYALLPREIVVHKDLSPQSTIQNLQSKIPVYTLREYLQSDDIDPESTPIILDSTFVDEEVTNSAGETLTLHRLMSCLQAVEEMVGEVQSLKHALDSDRGLKVESEGNAYPPGEGKGGVPPESESISSIRATQEKAAFFFAHLAHILQKLETKDLVLDHANWSITKVAESRGIAATLWQYIREIRKNHSQYLCVALIREMERIEIFLGRLRDFDQKFTVLIQARGNEEASLHITEQDRTHLLNVLQSKTERQIYIASPVRDIAQVLDIENSVSIPDKTNQHITAYLAEDMRPDQSLAYIEQLTTQVRRIVFEKKEKCVFVLSHGKVIEQMVIPLQKELNNAGITFYAEKMAGSASKLRDFLANKPTSILFCTLEFFTDLDQSLLDFDLCVLQKLPFVMSKAVDGDRNHFMDKVVPKSLYRFEQILCKLQRNQHPTDFVLLDNKILQGGYADKFRALLPENTQVMSAGLIVEEVLD